MTSKFEQLIEYVINDEEAKAKELFHDIVVEKSREIYENLMTEEEDEELEEAESTDQEDEKAEKAGEKVTKDIEHDDKKDRKERMDEEEDEEMDESMMADEELMDTVEAEEEGMEMQEAEGEEAEGEEGLEDRVVDLEDKLDELMAEFEALMGDEAGDNVGDEMGGDDLEMDDTETADFDMGNGEEEEETDSEEIEMGGMMEAVNLAKAPAPVTSEPAGTNTKGPIASNSGAKGAVASPVKMTGDTAQGRPAPKAGELIGKVQNSVGGDKKLSPATKPDLAQASGVNTKTPFPKA